MLLCFLSNVFLHAQDNAALFNEAESSMNRMFTRINAAGSYEDKMMITDSIINTFYHVLQQPGSFTFPFNVLRNVGNVTSKDQDVRIFTWNLPHVDGTNTYFGFLQYKTDKKDVRVIKLTDKSPAISNADKAELTAENWLGCLIYDIIITKYEGAVYYTLLGYDPENIFITQKLIDILWFNDKDEPVFGKPVFNYEKKICTRIIFEYSAKAQMSLRWNENMKMIVFDHLSPSQPMFSGNFQYYGPDFSFDALRFDKGIWELTEDIDVRNNNK
jgi:hypothetical protein